MSDPAGAADRVLVWATVYRPEIEAALTGTNGGDHRITALGAARLGRWSPPVYDWPYTADMWVRFAVRTHKRWFRPTVCRITVLRVSLERLPPPGG